MSIPRPGLHGPRAGRRRTGQVGWSLLTWSALIFALALGAVVQVSALPVEARTQETWYAYSHQIDFDYTAQVEPGLVYPTHLVKAGDLIRQRLPIDPPAYRRVLVPKLVQSLTFNLPYAFRADRPGEIHLTYRIDGELSAPGFWQRPFPLLPEQTLELSGTEVNLSDLQLDIPVRQIVADMEQLNDAQRLNYERLELKVRPVFLVRVAGQREPVEAMLQPEFVVAFRDREHALEVDEPRVVQDAQTRSITKVVPRTMALLGREVKVATVRLFSVITVVLLSVMVLGLGLIRFLRHRNQAVDDLRQLGGALIDSEQVEYPGEMVVVKVRSVRQMLTLHLQTHRPVIRTGSVCHLIDGNVCYRLVLKTETAD